MVCLAAPPPAGRAPRQPIIWPLFIALLYLYCNCLINHFQQLNEQPFMGSMTLSMASTLSKAEQ